MPPKNKDVTDHLQSLTPDIEEPAPPNTDPEEWEDNADLRKIREILRSADATGGKLRLERKGPLDHTFQYICQMPIEQFDIDQVKKVYGGGDYKVRTFRANGQMYKPFEFSIDYRVKGALDESAIKQLASNPQPLSADPTKLYDAITRGNTGNSQELLKMFEMMQKASESSTMLMLQMMSQSNERQMAMMTQMMASARQAAPPIDFGVAITPVLIEMIRNKGSSGTLTEQIANLKSIKEAFAPEAKDEEEDSPMFKLLKVIGPIAAGVLTGNRQPIMLPSPTPEAPGITTEHVKAGASVVGVQVPDDQVVKAQAQVNRYVNMLCSAADNNSDPSNYYDMLTSLLDTQQVLSIKSALTKDDWVVTLFGNDQRVVARRVWFEELRQLILNDGQLPPEHDASNQQPTVVQSP